MIDPTKDPFEVGKVIPLETVLERTVDLIAFCEEERKNVGCQKSVMKLERKKQTAG